MTNSTIHEMWSSLMEINNLMLCQWEIFEGTAVAIVAVAITVTENYWLVLFLVLFILPSTLY